MHQADFYKFASQISLSQIVLSVFFPALRHISEEEEWNWINAYVFLSLYRSTVLIKIDGLWACACFCLEMNRIFCWKNVNHANGERKSGAQRYCGELCHHPKLRIKTTEQEILIGAERAKKMEFLTDSTVRRQRISIIIDILCVSFHFF